MLRKELIILYGKNLLIVKRKIYSYHFFSERRSYWEKAETGSSNGHLVPNTVSASYIRGCTISPLARQKWKRVDGAIRAKGKKSEGRESLTTTR